MLLKVDLMLLNVDLMLLNFDLMLTSMFAQYLLNIGLILTH